MQIVEIGWDERSTLFGTKHLETDTAAKCPDADRLIFPGRHELLIVASNCERRDRVSVPLNELEVTAGADVMDMDGSVRTPGNNTILIVRQSRDQHLNVADNNRPHALSRRSLEQPDAAVPSCDGDESSVRGEVSGPRQVRFDQPIQVRDTW